MSKDQKVLVSACLVGNNCRYDSGSCNNQLLIDLFDKGLAVAVCPEEMGGLSTPRNPAERKNKTVMDSSGLDVTEQYKLGAREALKVAQQEKISTAYLKAKSPMCGCGDIYDGSFNNHLIPGDGVFTELLKQAGIKVKPTEAD